MSQTIYEYVKKEEANYRTLPIQVADNYEWQMYEHIRRTVLYKNSQFTTGNNDSTRPYKNVIRPILNLQYRAEGFDVKDIELFVNDPQEYYKSFLLKKYHEKWARENDIDTFIDDMVESYIDFGGALVKDVNAERPIVVPMQQLAFCDQTDILSGAICLRHNYSVDQLKAMEAKGWGNKANGATTTIDELITLCSAEKSPDNLPNAPKIKTPSKYIEVFELHGTFPQSWLTPDADIPDSDKYNYTPQMHIIAYYKGKETADQGKSGVTLFRGKEPVSPFKLVLRDKIYNRALGFGGAEELFEPQMWINYDMIRIKDMLDTACKIIIKTTDAGFANRQRTNKMKNGQVVEYAKGETVDQLVLTPTNLPLFENSITMWETQAKTMGSANDAIQGKNPASGTPFALQELVTQEAHSLHEYRKGKLATFLDEVYRDWIIPRIAREVVNDQEFISDLSLEEMQVIAYNLSNIEANKAIKEAMFSGKMIDQATIDALKKTAYENFMAQGSKHFIKILSGEMNKDLICVFVNIAGKQKDLFDKTQKLTNIFRQIIANPQALDDPRMAKLFNQIIESSGLDPIDFGSIPTQKPATPQAPIPVQNQPVPSDVALQQKVA